MRSLDDIREAVRQVRGDNTQKEIAEATGIPQPRVSAFLSGCGLSYAAGVAMQEWLVETGVWSDTDLIQGDQ